MQVRTDLAMESAQGAEGMPGVKVASWEESGVAVTEVLVEDEQAASRLGKDVGRYVTLESEGVRQKEPDACEAVSALLGEEILRLLPKEESDAPVMVVGLGNRMVTPDALGPKCVDGILVTRHLLSEMPQTTNGQLACVCAFAPGVLGVTGIETMESVRSLALSVKPRCLIAIDALASRASSRVGVSIQLTDAGIRPGSGVGNHRRALNEKTIGAPVIAIGMPTVVYASAIARDWLELTAEGEIEDEAVGRITRRLFENHIGEMIVTPREVDEMIEGAARIIARGINLALQPGLSVRELDALMKS